MYRNRVENLRSWQLSPSRRPLLIRGARQVGKTHLVEMFAEQHFDHFVKINFERSPQFKACFSNLDVNAIIQQLRLLLNEDIVAGKTLLFLDEIQDCPNAIMALRYFYEEMPDLHVIGAGSLLEFALADENFRMPVGRVSFMYLYPMTFMEVLQALGEDQLYDYLNNIQLTDRIPEAVHQQLLEKLELYFVLGGMPQVVSLYVQHRNLLDCWEAQISLLNSYRSDFGKYASQTQQGYCERVFGQSLTLIAKHFRYKDIDPDMDYRGLKQAVQLLFKAGILTPVYRTTASGLPLSATQIDKNYKVLFLDVGLVRASGAVSAQALQNRALLNQGALTEQYVGQHLLAIQSSHHRGELFYWQRDAKNSQAEMDYIFQTGNQLLPLEVKSGSTGRLRSMHLYMKEKGAARGIKVSSDAFDTTGAIWSIPLYMIEQLPRLVENLVGV